MVTTKQSVRVRDWRTPVTVVLVLAAIGLLLYPVVATVLNNFTQRQAAAGYQAEVSQVDQTVLAQQLEAAHEYNQHATRGPILDPWLARVADDNADYQHYLEHLNVTEAMGRLTIPSIDSDLPIYHGTADETLERGIGHLYGSDLPVGGEGTHAVLTAHTGLSRATLWDNLDQVVVGDAVYMSVAGQQMKYEVVSTQVVLPHEVDSLQPVDGVDQITLITCTPYGINTHRLLVHAHRVPLDPEEAEGSVDTGFSIQWWMVAMTLAAFVALVVLVWWLRRRRQEGGDN